MNNVGEIYNILASPQAVDESIAGLGGNGDTATQIKADVNNTSTFGRHRGIRWAVAYAMFALVTLWRIYKLDVQKLADEGHFGTKRWWVAKALEFQYGHDLVFTTKDAYYEVDDPDARIIGHAAVTSLAHKVIIKVVSPDWVPLTADQISALYDYCIEIRPPVIIQIVSAFSDKLWVPATIVYDAKQGLPGIKANVHAEIASHIKKLNDHGVLNLTQLKIAIMAVPGVTDVVFGSVKGRAHASTQWQDIVRVYESFAGWMTIDPDHSLDNSLTWMASNV